MRRLFAAVGTLFVVLAFTGVASAQSDPRIGTWKLDAAKSKFENQAYVRATETRTYESSSEGTKASSESVYSDGRKQAYGFNSTPDGKEYSYTGQLPGGAEKVSTKRVGNAYVASSTKGGKVLYTTTHVVSKDGKVLTVTTKGVDANGQNIGSVRVYEKQ
jgi:hypothetical protein